LKSKVALATGATGAKATVTMTHIVIQEALNRKVVEWMEEVIVTASAMNCRL